MVSFRSKGSCTRDDDHFIKSAQVQTDSIQVQEPMTQTSESYIRMESIGTQCDQLDPVPERPKTAKKKADIPDRPVFQNKFVRRPSSISKSPAHIPEIEEDEFSTTRVTRSKSGQTPRSDEVIQKQNLPSNMKTIMVMDENFEFGEKMVPRTPLYAPTPKWQPDDSQSRDSFSGSRDATIKSPITRSRSKLLKNSPGDSNSKSSECEKKFAVTVTRRSTVTTTSTPVRRIPTTDDLEDGELDSDSQSTQNSQLSSQNSQTSQTSSQQNTSCASSQDSILDSTVINREEPTKAPPVIVHRTPSNISLESHATNSQGSSNFGSGISGNQGLFSGPEISDMSQDSKTMAWHREDKLREQNKENIPESLRLRNVI